MLAFLSLGVARANAQFPPDGAVADPNNSAIATGIYPTPTRDGFGLKYVFYFDCGIGTWIGVAVAGSDNAQAQLLKGREFPSGPPPGSERDAADQNHAFNSSTGEDFVLRGGSWRNTKTGVPVESPQLCPVASHAPMPPSTKVLTNTGRVLEEMPLFPDAYRPPLGEASIGAPQKANRLPLRSAYIPDASRNFRTLNPDQGPIRISVPRPDGRLDVLH